MSAFIMVPRLREFTSLLPHEDNTPTRSHTFLNGKHRLRAPAMELRTLDPSRLKWPVPPEKHLRSREMMEGERSRGRLSKESLTHEKNQQSGK